MRWVNHKITTLAIGLATTGNPLFSFVAALSSTIPDFIEMGTGRLVFKKHRGLSHNPFFWFAILSVGYVAGRIVIARKIPYSVGIYPELRLQSLADVLLLGVIAGVVMHLLIDAMSISGIPLKGETRIAAGFYKTFDSSEKLVTLIIVGLCGLIYAIQYGYSMYFSR